MTLAPHDSVDVILPARGNTPWLQLSLSSIASQTLQPKRVTVVDDGLENSTAIATFGNQLFGHRFRLVKNDGRGISAGLNTGVQQSTAYWIARMDADDIAYPNRFEQQVLSLQSWPREVLGCGTQVRFINSKGHGLHRSHLPSSWENITKQMLSRTSFVHSSLIIRRDALMAIPYRSVMDGAEDLDLALRLCEKGKLLNLDQVLLDYRIHLTQESFRMRARHTAVQELALRLALSRRKKHFDPLETDPLLIEKFIDWRLSTPGYVRSRTFLTALRYMATHFSGCDINGSWRCFWIALKSLPLLPGSIFISWRVFRRAAAALLNQPTPFPSLNLN
jgi:glycosyltransferase involved in cell wall biosynthesis